MEPSQQDFKKNLQKLLLGMFQPGDEEKKDFQAKLANNTEIAENTLKLKNIPLLRFKDKIDINNYHQLGINYPHVIPFQTFGKGDQKKVFKKEVEDKYEQYVNKDTAKLQPEIAQRLKPVYIKDGIEAFVSALILHEGGDGQANGDFLLRAGERAKIMFLKLIYDSKGFTDDIVQVTNAKQVGHMSDDHINLQQEKAFKTESLKASKIAIDNIQQSIEDIEIAIAGKKQLLLDNGLEDKEDLSELEAEILELEDQIPSIKDALKEAEDTRDISQKEIEEIKAKVKKLDNRLIVDPRFHLVDMQKLHKQTVLLISHFNHQGLTGCKCKTVGQITRADNGKKAQIALIKTTVESAYQDPDKEKQKEQKKPDERQQYKQQVSKLLVQENVAKKQVRQNTSFNVMNTYATMCIWDSQKKQWRRVFEEFKHNGIYDMRDLQK